MNGLDTSFYYVSSVLQLAAMFFAIKMMRQAKNSGPWLALFVALVIMFVQRIFALTLPIEVRLHIGPPTSIVVSTLLLIALFSIQKISAAEHVSRRLAEQRTAERDESEDRYRALADLSPDAMIVTSDDLIVYANVTAHKLFGTKDNDGLIGKSPKDFSNDGAALAAELFGETTHVTQQAQTTHVEEWERIDGTKLPVEVASAMIPWRGGQAMQLIVRDISDRVRVAQEKSKLLANERAARSVAEHASRMKDEFLATLSHELRTPLNAILGWAQILQGTPSKDEDLRRGLETIERNARAQTELVEDLLDMSRIVSGKLRLHVQRVIPSTFIEEAIAAVKPGAEAKGVRLEATLDTTAGPISADPQRLQQVVWNLLSNAIKFTPKGGKVQVRLERVNSHIEITVADTGEGVPVEFLPHVFDRFRQADSSTTRKQGGLGLGLAIVKQLVELHGGQVKMTSPGEGLGTTVTISLPVTIVHTYVDQSDRSHPRSSVSPTSKMSAPIDLAGVKVLIVDDEPDALAMVRKLLEQCGANVTSAVSAAAALLQLKSEPPDVVVSDIGMPVQDGYSLMKEIRNLPTEAGGRVPAIALTAFARSEDRTRALMAGYQVHISKPVEPQELVVTVASLVGRTGDAKAVLTSSN